VQHFTRFQLAPPRRAVPQRFAGLLVSTSFTLPSFLTPWFYPSFPPMPHSLKSNHSMLESRSSSLTLFKSRLCFCIRHNEAKCTVTTAVCVSVCLSVPRRISTLLTHPDVTLGSGRGCPLVIHSWEDLQSVHGFRCYGNIRN